MTLVLDEFLFRRNSCRVPSSKISARERPQNADVKIIRGSRCSSSSISASRDADTKSFAFGNRFKREKLWHRSKNVDGKNSFNMKENYDDGTEPTTWEHFNESHLINPDLPVQFNSLPFSLSPNEENLHFNQDVDDIFHFSSDPSISFLSDSSFLDDYSENEQWRGMNSVLNLSDREQKRGHLENGLDEYKSQYNFDFGFSTEHEH